MSLYGLRLAISLMCFTPMLSFAQRPGDLPPNALPGRCYGKVLITGKDTHGTVLREGNWVDTLVFVYTGELKSERKGGFYREQFFTSEITGSRWEKRRADRNCLSKDSLDCMAWCLVDPDILELKLVTDTTDRRDWKAEYFEVYVPPLYADSKEGGYTEWREIVCNDELTAKDFDRLTRALELAGHPLSSDGPNGLKQALVAYQRRMGFGVGQYTEETLKGLVPSLALRFF